jgi:hypothetical protein
MSRTKLVELIQQLLSTSEITALNEINTIKDSEDRQRQLRMFFHKPEIFSKIKHITDPAWLSYEIFIKGKDYEF